MAGKKISTVSLPRPLPVRIILWSLSSTHFCSGKEGRERKEEAFFYLGRTKLIGRDGAVSSRGPSSSLTHYTLRRERAHAHARTHAPDRGMSGIFCSSVVGQATFRRLIFQGGIFSSSPDSALILMARSLSLSMLGPGQTRSAQTEKTTTVDQTGQKRTVCPV